MWVIKYLIFVVEYRNFHRTGFLVDCNTKVLSLNLFDLSLSKSRSYFQQTRWQYYEWMNCFVETTSLKIFKHYKLEPSFPIIRSINPNLMLFFHPSGYLSKNQSELISTNFKSIWSKMTQFESIWTKKSTWSILIFCDPIWTNLIWFDLIWIDLICLYLIWIN